MKIFLVLAILLLSAFDAALAQDKSAGPIVWQLKNPFRYFTDADHTAMHRKAFQALSGEQKGEPVLAVERALAAKSGGRGWAEAVFQKVMDEACWSRRPKADAAAKGKSGEPCGAYIKPKTYDVLLSAPGLQVRARGSWLRKPSRPRTAAGGLRPRCPTASRRRWC